MISPAGGRKSNTVPLTVDFLVQPGAAVNGAIDVPGDKSISHRALMIGAVAEGDTLIRGFLPSEDTEATLSALHQMGVRIDRPSATEVVVRGVGLYGLRAPAAPLYLGNSGTSARLLAGLLSGQNFDVQLQGDESLMRQPMRRVTDPLRQMGADISCSPDGTPPVRIRGGASLAGISYDMPVASAQVKSALLLAGLYAAGATCVREPATTRDHTERMLAVFGVHVSREANRICVTGGTLTGRAIEVPGDISSAAFFLVAASIVPHSELLLRAVGVNPTRAAVIDILRSMGASIERRNEREISGEPVADLHVRHRPLRSVRIPRDLVSIAIDEFPAILVAAACARGETVLEGAAELRVKETDRIAAMAAGLQAVGIEARPAPDGIRVRGGELDGGEIDSRGDHRIAMAFAVAGLAARRPLRVRDCANVSTSFPGFADAFAAAGARIVLEQGRGG